MRRLAWETAGGLVCHAKGCAREPVWRMADDTLLCAEHRPASAESVEFAHDQWEAALAQVRDAERSRDAALREWVHECVRAGV